MNVSEVLTYFEKVSTCGENWKARCPAHSDNRESLSIGVGKSGAVVMKCHAGCDLKTIMDIVGLTYTDLYPRKEQSNHSHRIVAVYPYNNELNQPLFEVVRYEPKDFKARWTDENGNHHWNIKGIKRVLYKLPELCKTPIEDTVYVVEGEKDVHTLIELGLKATCNPGGAGKWKQEYCPYFQDRNVVVIPDNDKAGLDHAVQVCREILPFVASVKLLQLPSTKKKADLTDWVKRGGTAEELTERTEAAYPFNPKYLPPSPEVLQEEIDKETEVENKDALPFLNDEGNGKLLIAKYGGVLRHNEQMGWFVYNDHVWVQSTLRVQEYAKRLSHDILELILEPGLSSKQIRKIKSWADHSANIGRIRAAMDTASSDPIIDIQVDQLDANPWLINFKNSTMDLLTGERMDQKPEHMMTMTAGATFSINSECPIWDHFLSQIMGGNQDLIHDLQQAVGYSLTGDISERCLFILYGTGANGKSTFLETLSHVFGDYADQVPMDLIRSKEMGNSQSSLLAKVRGKRFVTAVESGSSFNLSEELIKTITGGDTIVARELYGKWFSFKPQFKLWLATNHEPTIRGGDKGIWHRIRKIPFTVEIQREHQDPGLVDKLCAEKSGILNWALEGLASWISRGRKIAFSEATLNATNDYHEREDASQQFIDLALIPVEGSSVSTALIYKAYKTWCEEQGIRPKAQISMTKMLLTKGLQYKRTEHSRDFTGVRLSPDGSRLAAGRSVIEGTW